MRIKTFLIATLIIGAMTFPFRHNVMPVVAHSASPAASTATAAAAQDINPLASYDAQITNFNPFSLLFGQNVMPDATHSAFPAALTATAAVPDYPSDGSNPDRRIEDGFLQYSMLSRGTTPSRVETFYKTNYCDEAWQLVNTSPSNLEGPYQIVHSNTQTCVGVPGDGNGVVAVQTACNKQLTNQLWKKVTINANICWFINVHSGKYLCHAGMAPVKQYSAAGMPGHELTYFWSVRPWDGEKTSSGKCLPPN